MLQSSPAARLGPVRIPDCSADWRFLLPVTENSSVLIVTHGCDEFSLSLEAINVKSTSLNFADFIRGMEASAPFDIIAFPSGIPNTFSPANTDRFRDLLANLLQSLRPEGAILFGFANHLRLANRQQGRAIISGTQEQVRHAFLNAGFSAVEIYAALPNLEVPEFIFSPIVEELQFVLRRRYRYKLPGLLLELMCSNASTNLLLRAIPFYYAVAYRSKPSGG